MEEDIENIERVIDYIQLESPIIQGIGNAIYTDSLKKLLKRYKELEEENKELKKNYINPSKARISYYDTKKGTEVVIEGFIPISVIQNKIEWLKLIADNGMNAVRFACSKEDEIERIQKQKDINTMINILQELLKRKE